METKQNKAFDCIGMKREVQEAIRAQVRGMTREEEVAYFRAGAEEFEASIEAARQQRRADPSTKGI